MCNSSCFVLPELVNICIWNVNPSDICYLWESLLIILRCEGELFIQYPAKVVGWPRLFRTKIFRLSIQTGPQGIDPGFLINCRHIIPQINLKHETEHLNRNVRVF